ncbi:MAG: hypothetical protein N2039_06525 [Gemmataceae bacterium]|nr:hypothetical protein [Gemmataceae bacterium]
MTHELARICREHLAREEESLTALRRAIAAVREAWSQGSAHRLNESIEQLGHACRQSAEVERQRHLLAERLGRPIHSLSDLATELPAETALEVDRFNHRLRPLADAVRDDLHQLHQALRRGHSLLSSFLSQWQGEQVDRYGPTGERLAHREARA